MKEELSRREEINEDGIKTVFTKMLFTFEDGSTKTVDIPHFNPQEESDIQLGVSNRFITEQRALTESL